MMSTLRHELLKPATREVMQKRQIDAWLTFHDPDHTRNPAAVRLFGASGVKNLTAPFLGVVYADPSRKPMLIASVLEESHYGYFAEFGDLVVYKKGSDVTTAIKRALRGCVDVATEYTPGAFFGPTAMITAELMDLLRSIHHVRVVSSGELLQYQATVLTDQELASHVRAAQALTAIIHETFTYVSQNLSRVSEYEVQRYMLELYVSRGLDASSPPIVAVNDNAANPHYSPDQNPEAARIIKHGDLILFDFWAREANNPDAIYADLGWMAYAGDRLSDEHGQAFKTLLSARDAVLAKAADLFGKGKPLVSHVLDRAARKLLTDAGYPNFPHATGHSITTLVHGEGTRIGPKNYGRGAETRLVIPGSLSSDEPGIYLKGQFGMRVESDMYIHPISGPQFTCEAQTKMVFL